MSAQLLNHHTIELQSCTMEFFRLEQHTDNAWIKNGNWQVLNVETYEDSNGYVRQRVWLWRSVAYAA